MSKKPETVFWEEIKDNIKNVHFQRIENLVGLGIPDVNCCTQGCEFWLELKVGDGRFPDLSKYQIAWHYRRFLVGGKSFILQKSLRRGQLELFEGGQVSDIENAVPVFVCSLPVSANISSVFSFIVSRFPFKYPTLEDFSPNKQIEIPFIKKLKLTKTIPL
jgi:hypothetical protein